METRPLPLSDDASAGFWEACARRELCIQACAECGARRFPPRLLCPACRSGVSTWPAVCGRARVFSYVVCHPPVLPAFRERAPYAVLLVELEEDPRIRLIGNLLDAPPEAARIGLAVEVCFEEVGDGVVLPQWRPAQRSRATNG